MNFPIFAFCLIAFCPVVLGERTELNTDSDEYTSAEALVAGAVILANRFQLVQSLWRQDMDTRRIEHAPLSSSVTSHFANTRELYAGSFGEAWSAVDRQTGKKIVLKMFYTQDPAMPGKTKILTWNLAHQLMSRNPQIAPNLEDAAAECTTARNLQAGASQDPVGASRMMQCFEDHVTRGVSTTGHKVSDEDQLYQVLEDCGTSPLNEWITNHKPLASFSAVMYVTKVMRLFKQMLQALRYLNAIGYVHHDLKPANMVVKVLEDGHEIIKFIDLGAVTAVTEENARHRIVATVPFAPPEWFPPAKGFNYRAPWSFDLYAVAAILDEMMTGSMFYVKLLKEAQRTGELSYAMNACVQNLQVRRVPHDQAQQTCQQETEMSAVKGTSVRYGSEARITGTWGKDRVHRYMGIRDGSTQTRVVQWARVANVEVPKLQHLLFAGPLPAEYVKVAALYERMALQTGWFRVFMAMVAFDPTVRPTPSRVLQSRFLEHVDDVLEPGVMAPTSTPEDVLAPPVEPNLGIAASAEPSKFENVGRGKCLDADGSHLGSTYTVTCVSLKRCKEQCGGTCAGIAWAAAPTDKSVCANHDLPRCEVYSDAANDATITSSTHQEYKCYRPVEEAAPTHYDSVEVVSTEPTMESEPERDPPVPCPNQDTPGKLLLCIKTSNGKWGVISP